MAATTVTIPNRPVFRAQEVCELAEVQPFVLRTWEAEFPELGVAKTPTSPRVYRRADVERVLRIKHLVFIDGLTLAGARRRLSEEGFGAIAEDAAVVDADVAAMIDTETRQQLRDVRRGLQWILGVLSGEGTTAADYVLTAPPPSRGRAPMRSGAHAPAHVQAKSTARTAKSARPVKVKMPAKAARRKK
jgi:DNA-binding transcriptional MerR regulator